MKALIKSKYALEIVSDTDSEGYEFIASPAPECESTQVAIPYYQLQDDIIYQLWEIKESLADTQRQLKQAKAQLSQTDYMVIKNLELMQAGKPLEYDAEQLHNLRAPLREEINRLEALINA